MGQEPKALATVCCRRCGALLAKTHEEMHKDYHKSQDHNLVEMLAKVRDVSDRVTRLQESQQALARHTLRIEEKDNTLDGKITELGKDVTEIVDVLRAGLAPVDWPASWRGREG